MKSDWGQSHVKKRVDITHNNLIRHILYLLSPPPSIKMLRLGPLYIRLFPLPTAIYDYANWQNFYVNSPSPIREQARFFMASTSMSRFLSYDFIVFKDLAVISSWKMVSFLGFYLPPYGVLPFKRFRMTHGTSEWYMMVRIIISVEEFKDRHQEVYLVELIVYDKDDRAHIVFAPAPPSFVDACCDLVDKGRHTLVPQDVSPSSPHPSSSTVSNRNSQHEVEDRLSSILL